MEVAELMKETENAYKQLEICIDDYDKLESEASKDIKILMLINGWHSPYEVCTELVKRIETDEAYLKNLCKASGTSFSKIGHKPKSKMANELMKAGGIK